MGSRCRSEAVVAFMPCLVRTWGGGGGELIGLGHPLLDAYVELVTARARWNTVLATAFDLKVFFSIVDKDPLEVTTADVLEFIKAQRAPRHAAAWRQRCADRGRRGGAVGSYDQTTAGHDRWAV